MPIREAEITKEATGRKTFAIVPAAGRSLRMGPRHKLLLPWPTRDSQTAVIDSVLGAWLASRVDHVCLVVRGDDVQLQHYCQHYCQEFSVDVVHPPDVPPHMKDSVQFALEWLDKRYRPSPQDYWLVAPADLPNLNATVIDRVVQAVRGGFAFIPRFGDQPEAMRKGHPVAFPWAMVPKVAQLGPKEGLNCLLEKMDVQWLDCPAKDYPRDIDTPEEYEKMLLDVTGAREKNRRDPESP